MITYGHGAGSLGATPQHILDSYYIIHKARIQKITGFSTDEVREILSNGTADWHEDVAGGFFLIDRDGLDNSLGYN